jgi:hypothetical protein
MEMPKMASFARAIQATATPQPRERHVGGYFKGQPLADKLVKWAEYATEHVSDRVKQGNLAEDAALDAAKELLDVLTNHNNITLRRRVIRYRPAGLGMMRDVLDSFALTSGTGEKALLSVVFSDGNVLVYVDTEVFGGGPTIPGWVEMANKNPPKAHTNHRYELLPPDRPHGNWVHPNKRGGKHATERNKAQKALTEKMAKRKKALAKADRKAKRAAGK